MLKAAAFDAEQSFPREPVRRAGELGFLDITIPEPALEIPAATAASLERGMSLMQAARAFWVNRIVTGGVEVFREGEMLRLELRDAGSMATREELRIPLEPKTVLADSLPRALARLLDLPTAGTAPIRAMLPSAASAMVDYLAWGSTNQVRYPVALAAGLWPEEEVVAVDANATGLALVDRTQPGPQGWRSVTG